MDLPLLPAAQQLALLRDKRVSPRELVEEYIRRIERLNPSLNAFTFFDADSVRASAAALPQGPLYGLPLTIKSSIEARGMPCEIGSTLRRGTIAAQDAEAVSQLRSAGAMILGTTNCPEFLMSYDTANDLHGRTSNPRDLSRSAGGSSGGEAAAIAACLSAGGLGSDSGGSVRVPAHFTGICALKPTPVLISSSGHQPPCVGPFSSLGSIGPMARTIEDVALIFHAVSGPEQSGAVQITRPAPAVSLADAKAVPVLWVEPDGSGPVTAATEATLEQAAAELERSGFVVHRRKIAALTRIQALWRIFFLQCGEMFYRDTIAGHEANLSLHFREFLQEAASMPPLTAPSLLAAWAEMDRCRAAFWAEIGPAVLLTPVCSVPAFRHGERSWTIAGQTVNYWDAMRFAQWFNLLACPAAVVPVATSEERLPIGVQIAAAPFEDELVLTVAGVLDERFGYSPLV